MLPKPEKIKKKKTKPDNGEQEVQELSPEAKLKRKRSIVILSLSLTIGLSLVFWVYNFFKTFSFSEVNFKFNFSLPRIELNNSSVSKTVNLDNELTPILANDKNIWSFYIKSDSFLWEKNSSQISSLDPEFKKSESSLFLIKKLLPSGVEVQENDIFKDNFIEVQSSITVPNKEIILIIKVSGNNLENSKKLIPKLAEKIYWAVVGL